MNKDIKKAIGFNDAFQRYCELKDSLLYHCKVDLIDHFQNESSNPIKSYLVIVASTDVKYVTDLALQVAKDKLSCVNGIQLVPNPDYIGVVNINLN